MTKQKKSALFVAVFYGAALAIALLYSLFCFAADSFGRITGRITQQEYDFSTLTLYDMEAEDATHARSTGSDPQLILDGLTGNVVDVRFTITFDAAPGEVNLYYARAGEAFSSTKRIWGKAKSDGSYVFTLPRTKIGALRIDPTSFAGVGMALHSFTVNAPRTFLSYFAYSKEEIFNFIVYPGLAAAFAAWILGEIWPKGKPLLKKKEQLS